MNTEEKAKAYDEALEKAKAHINSKGIGDTVDLCRHLFPELRESEDERIRKWIVNYLHRCVFDEEEHPKALKAIEYLEKQKINTEGDFSRGYDCGYEACLNSHGAEWFEKQKEPHFTKRNALFDKCVENCNPKTVEEVNKRVDDIMNMSELSAFEQALTNFIGYWEDDEERWPSKFVKKHGKHILDMAREELQKEQKPVQSDVEREYVRTLKSLISDFLRGKEDVDREYYQQIFDWLDGRHLEQKAAEWAELQSEFKNINEAFEDGKKEVVAYPEKYGLCQPAEWSEDYREEDLRTRFAFYTYKDEDGVLYLSNVFVEETSRNHGFGTRILAAAEKVAETIGATTISLKVKQGSPANAWYRKNGYGYVAFEDGYDWLEKNLEYMKPNKQEWSEEDRLHYTNVLEALEYVKGCKSDYDKIEAVKSDIAWFKSLRPQSHWKPTEEQMKALLKVVDKARELHYSSNSGYAEYDVLRSLYKQLKEL